MSSKGNKSSKFREKKRFRRKVKEKRKRKARRKKTHESLQRIIDELGGDLSLKNIISHWLPPTLNYIISTENSDFNLSEIKKHSPPLARVKAQSFATSWKRTSVTRALCAT